ncbi:hypothetical protein [Sporosarcina sp. FSL K6-1508]|uniref:hypothetical protein n=1 Tax=Sporosarcina sp. FSL K6-1508 TaxID=2921553 RepID=UPI0030FAF712
MNKNQIVNKMKKDFEPVLDLLLITGFLTIAIYFLHSKDIKGWIALSISIYCIITFIYLDVLNRLGIGLKNKREL